MKRKFDRLAKMRLPGLMPWRLPPYGGIDAVMEIPDICHEPMNAVANPISGQPARTVLETIKGHSRKKSIWALLAKAAVLAARSQKRRTAI
jgi:hypothetical protein